MATLSTVRFVAPEISQAQLETIARTLDIEVSNNTEVLKDRCFESSYQVCKSGQWDRIDPIVQELSLLVDKVGRTLLLRAIMEQNDAVVRGLTDRAIGLTTTDLKGNSVLVYLDCRMAGISTNRYESWLIEKLKTQFSEQSLDQVFQEQSTRVLSNFANQVVLKHIIADKESPEESIEMLKHRIGNDYRKFGYLHPGTLNYLRALETLQRKLGKAHDADATKEEYRKGFSFLFGFEPTPIEEFSKEEILSKARNGHHQEVGRFIDSCQTRYMATPEKILEIRDLLIALSGFYRLDKEKALHILRTLFLMPKAMQEEGDPLIFADCYRRAGVILMKVPKAFYEADAFFNKAIAFCDLALDKDHPLRLQCLSDRTALKLFVGNLKEAEVDYRKIVAVAEKTTKLPHPFFLCEAYMHLASILLGQKKYEESLEYSRKSYELCQKLGAEKNPHAKRVYISSIGDICRNLVFLNRCDEAFPYAEHEVQLWKTEDNAIEDLAIAFIDLGNVLKGKKISEKEKALENYKKAYDLLKEGSQTKPKAAASLGQIYLQLGNFKEAAHWSQKASELFSKIQGVLPHEHWKITIFEQQVDVYRQWENALVLDRQVQALLVSDLRRSRVLAHTLSNRVFPGKDASTGLTLQEMFDVAKAHKTTFVVYSLLNDDVGACYVITSQGTLKIIQINVKNIFLKGLENLLSETSITSRGNAEALPFANLYEQFNKLAARAQASSEATRGDSDDDEEWEAMLKKANTVVAEKESKIREQFHIQLKLWYKELIEPIKEFLPQSPEETVTFIPDGPMAMFPFAIFEKPNGSYFVEEHASLVSPSIRVVHLLGELKNQRRQVAPSGKSVVICNPKSEKVNKLVTGDKEGQEVGALLHTPQERLMLGSSATVNNTIPLMRDAQWIHVTSHGNANETEPDNPNALYKGHLFFTPDKDHSEGKLYAEEISKIKLEAEFAFLSACYSGRGNTEYIHEGLVGFSRALASGGVLTTASSYWQLPDTDQTVSMIKTFYEHVLGQNGRPKLGKAIALQRAVLEFVNKEGENNPHKWNREDPHKWGALFLTGIN